jgi:hypothetical protein
VAGAEGGVLNQTGLPSSMTESRIHIIECIKGVKEDAAKINYT